MNLTRIVSYVAEVELLGEMRVVEIDSMRGTLTIRGVTMEQAHGMLERLAEGRLKAVSPPATMEPAAEPVPARVLAMVPPQPEPAPAPAPVAEPTAPPVAEPAPAPAASASGLPAEVLNATRVGDVVKWVVATMTGASDDDIVQRVLAIQPEVGLLARVTNLEDRVRRQLAVIER